MKIHILFLFIKNKYTQKKAEEHVEKIPKTYRI